MLKLFLCSGMVLAFFFPSAAANVVWKRVSSTDTMSEDRAEETSIVKPVTGVVTESAPTSRVLYLSS